MNVLIITKSNDHSGVENTIEKIKQKGGNPIRFNTDLFPKECGIDVRYEKSGENITFITPERTIDLENIDSLYYRRVLFGNILPSDISEEYRQKQVDESRNVLVALMEGFELSGKTFMLDRHLSVRRADNKQFQLKMAKTVGLDIPKTLYTNSPDAVRKFAASCKEGIITKMQTPFMIRQSEQDLVVYTSKMKSEDLNNLDGLRLSPMTFQELLVKKMEYRVTIVGNKIFSSAIDSSSIEGAEIDWRRNISNNLRKWIPKDLPESTNNKLLHFMDLMKLQYGAIDIIETWDHRFVFLEVNACGEYHWLDKQREMLISDAIAELLMGGGRRRF